jgi:IS5 family transposase
VRLVQRIDWGFLEQAFGAVYTDGPGSPPLATRLMAGLHILKYSENLSDERLCEIWAENPYFQYFCGEEFFQHTLVFDRSSMTRWRQRMGEERLNALLQESLAVVPEVFTSRAPAFPVGREEHVGIGSLGLARVGWGADVRGLPLS